LHYADVERADYRGLPLKGPGAMIPDLAGARITEFRFRLRRGPDFAPPKQYAGLSLAILEPAGTWRELEEGQIQLNDCPSGEWARVRVPVSKRWQDELTGMASLHFGLLNGGEQSLSGTLEIDDIAVVVAKRE
jgi:hypothetical protein